MTNLIATAVPLHLIIIGVLILIVILFVGYALVSLKTEVRQVGNVIGQIAYGFGLLWCWMYCIQWHIRRRSQDARVRTAARVLLLGSFWVFAEFAFVVVRLLQDEGGGSAEPTETSRGIAATILSYIPSITALPLWAEVLLLIVAALVLLHHVSEWRLRLRESFLPGDLAKLIATCRSYMVAAPTLDDAKQKAFFDAAAASLHRILTTGRRGGRRKEDLVVSLMTADDQVLISRWCHPPNGTPGGQTLSIAKSAAGRAYQLCAVLYVPSTRHLIGIDATTYQTVGVVYEPTASPDPVRSLICTPIRRDDAVAAILNVSSSKTNSFGALDVSIVTLVAVLLEGVTWSSRKETVDKSTVPS